MRSEDSEMPLVSVIMPAYNAERFIHEAIESILAQSYPKWELLIIDDASTDATAEVVRKFSDPRIRYFKTERLGKPALVRNKARTMCQGSLVMFFDADDILFSGTMQAYVDALQDRERTAVYGFVEHMSESGQLIPSAGYKLIQDQDGRYKAPNAYQHTWDRIATCRFVGTPNLMVRKDALDSVGWFDDDLPSAEDMHLYLKLFLDCKDGVVFIPQYVIRYRQNHQSLTRKRSNMEKLLVGHLQALDRFYANPTAPGEIHRWRAMAYARRYNYVAGICLGEGYRLLAMSLVLRALRDRRVGFLEWLRHCPSTMLRCLLPLRWDMKAKEWAVQIRDGVVTQKLKQNMYKNGIRFAPSLFNSIRSSLT